MASFFETGDIADLANADVRDNRFWSMKVLKKKATTIKEFSEGGCMVHVTNASLGVDVNKSARVVVRVNEIPICVLSNRTPTLALDLNFNSESTTEFIFDLKGRNVPDEVYLTGHVSFNEPPVPMPADARFEDAEEVVEKEQDEAEDVEMDDDEKQIEEPEPEPEPIKSKKSKKKEKKVKEKKAKEQPKQKKNVESSKNEGEDAPDRNAEGHLRCSVCSQYFPREAFSKSQLKKKEKRKSKACLAKMQN